MTSATNTRTPYVARTPEATHFAPDIPLVRLNRALSSASVLQSETQQPGSFLNHTAHAFHASWKKFSIRCSETFRNNIGLLMIAFSQAFGSSMNVFVKKLNNVDPAVSMFELITVRMAITWMCCVIYMVVMKVPDPILGPKGVRLLLVFRGICGFTGVFGLYYSLQYLSLSDATVLQFLAPMCTAVAGAVVLKEDFKRSQAVASAFSLVGVVLIARPTFLFGGASNDAASTPSVVIDDRAIGVDWVTPAQRLAAVGISMISVLGATGAYTTIRAIGKQAHPMHTVIAYATQCVIYSTIAMLITREPFVIPTRVEWIVMLGAIGIFGFSLQILLTMGLQRKTAGRGTMAIYVQIIFATFNDLVFFHSIPSPLSILGTVIILSSAIYVALSKKPPSNHKRMGSIIGNPDDLSVEEGLLANQEDEDKVEDVETFIEVVTEGSVDNPQQSA
ncbi:DUF6-domain-containing protein [Laetiporus sulphureus 93-53]|uniref:DUF6-domain-containing protein n=1 Tax=Laetiporus sulphureus 93-53 TaxID=1314785 RepID=A0A165CLM2_9APHY|nr:DUF6-domain-containing protein [Laetiporus sulphureus 93-53]KZT03030.1 DUF6-domain-containing protein [Laetiporus sulphureus 93-53]